VKTIRKIKTRKQFSGSVNISYRSGYSDQYPELWIRIRGGGGNNYGFGSGNYLDIFVDIEKKFFIKKVIIIKQRKCLTEKQSFYSVGAFLLRLKEITPARDPSFLHCR
jgi:hypothetical protein